VNLAASANARNDLGITYAEQLIGYLENSTTWLHLGIVFKQMFEGMPITASK